MRLLSVAMAILSSSPPAAAIPVEACVPQPMPPAIDSAGNPPIASDLIEFAATPSLDHPGRAWVIRVSRRGRTEAMVEIIRLRRQLECNRYDVENRWLAPMRQDQYDAIAAKIVPLGIPPAAVFVPSAKTALPDLVLDGTVIELRLRNAEWQVTRALNYYGTAGVGVSAIFRQLASQYVPASELPAEDWRTVPAGK